MSVYHLIKFIIVILFTNTLLINSSIAFDCLLDSNNDGNADSNVDTDEGAISSGGLTIACGKNSKAFGTEGYEGATAYGAESLASPSATAIGEYANADTLGVAVGAVSKASDTSVALGYAANTLLSKYGGVAVGNHSSANSEHSVAIGSGAGRGLSNHPVGLPYYSDSSIAIGFRAGIEPYSANSIAIGGNDESSGDAYGAIASSRGAIALGSETRARAENSVAIGTNTVANQRNTIVLGYPIIVEQNGLYPQDYKRSILTLNNKGPASFRVQDSTTNDAWIFRQTIDKGFAIDALNTIGQQEFKISEGGNIKILGTLTEGSSRDSKKNIQLVNETDVLKLLDELSIHQWTYKHEKNHIKHMGPMAEDFKNVFNLGSTSKGISSIDTNGVALAAIKALKKENKQLKDEKDRQIRQLQSENAILYDEIENIKAMIAKLGRK